MVEEIPYIIIRLNLLGMTEKFAYVHSRYFVYSSAQTTDFNNH
jgi:hypothetical protein